MARRLGNGVHWHTETLGDYCTRVAKATPKLAYDMTDKVLDVLQQRIRHRTPVSSEPGRVGGELRESIHKTPIISSEGMFRTPLHRSLGYIATAHHYEGTVETDKSYAPYVEYDTGKFGERGTKYPIRPKHGKALAFWSKKLGRFIIVARVNHPGSRGVHMFARGAATMTEASINKQVRPLMSAWRAEHAAARPK